MFFNAASVDIVHRIDADHGEESCNEHTIAHIGVPAQTLGKQLGRHMDLLGRDGTAGALHEIDKSLRFGEYLVNEAAYLTP